ncbi:hypothetical protein KORDIASMS9_01379 [Kordia sp. SMS9]|uniref:hypothetical protein n=1 Tax=Kordia sp. SMS9 TaxID=2282170 RepID=UPI000E101F52|nr:hypothetical protein [Kordia sp. SMS9]AXG69160.1 hypothetical protein KORDIASMS9_01379 [Kordia sp. SMS9]
MKKKTLEKLQFSKKTISNLRCTVVKGGASALEWQCDQLSITCDPSFKFSCPNRGCQMN